MEPVDPVEPVEPVDPVDPVPELEPVPDVELPLVPLAEPVGKSSSAPAPRTTPTSVLRAVLVLKASFNERTMEQSAFTV